MLPELRAMYEELGAAFAEFEGVEAPESFGDPVAEHLAVRRAAGILDRSRTGRLRIEGEDSIDFLQGLLSNDLRGLSAGEGCEALLLTPKGRLVADLRIVCRGDHSIVEVAAPLRESLTRKLSMYVLRQQVSITDVTDRFAVLSVHGPEAAQVLRRFGFEDLPGAVFGSCSGPGAEGEVFAVRSDWLGEDGYDVHVPVADAPRIHRGLREVGATPVGLLAEETLRIEAGSPRWGAELTDRVLPPEIPALLARAVSYEKGCYMGQETVARIRTYGHVNRELRGLLVEGREAPAAGAAVFDREKQVGSVTSSCLPPTRDSAIALAFVDRGANELESVLAVDVGGERRRAKVTRAGDWE